MDKREYLRSLGFEVGERGRFSAEMMTALAQADVSFEPREKTQESYGEERIIPSLPPQTVVRKARQLFGYTSEGYKVGFVTCRRCSYHMMYCNCSEGILAPSVVVACDDKAVMVGSQKTFSEQSA